MRASELDLIFAPDRGVLASDHWQARWSAKLSTARFLELDRGNDDLEAWIAAVSRAASEAVRPVVFVAHSVGALAVAHAAPALVSVDVRGAFLVAPPSDAALGTLVAKPWTETPRHRLPWPSVLIGSGTDPWASPEYSRELAEAWGSTFVDAGEAGRIDAESGHGPWPDGTLRLAGFLKNL
jgi:predicted alpha/beta hydrolase family esterase